MNLMGWRNIAKPVNLKDLYTKLLAKFTVVGKTDIQVSPNTEILNVKLSKYNT